MTTTPRTTYDRVAIILHWLMAILLIGMLLLGEDMMEIEKEIGEDHGEGGIGLINLHVNIGIAILVLTVLRIVWRIANPPPTLPDTVKPWEKKLATITYGLFYVLMIGLPLTGWFALPGFLAKHSEVVGLNLFGFMDFPLAPAVPMKTIILHKLGSKIALALLALHVLAALKHQFIDDTKIFSRMMPH
jgi:cytochrome b561